MGDDARRDGLRIVSAIGAEFERIEALESQTGPISVHRFGRRTIALALVGGLLAAVGAGAATGLLPIGSVIPASPHAPPRESAHTVVARGETPVAGRWQMTYFLSGRLASLETGVVNQRAGLPMLDIGFLDRPSSAGFAAAGPADFDNHPGFGRHQLPVWRDGSGELLVYGAAPERATAVELILRGGPRLRVDLIDGPSAVGSDFWLTALPPRLADRPGHVRWIDERHGAVGRPVRLTVPNRGWFRTIPKPERGR